MNNSTKQENDKIELGIYLLVVFTCISCALSFWIYQTKFDKRVGLPNSQGFVLDYDTIIEDLEKGNIEALLQSEVDKLPDGLMNELIYLTPEEYFLLADSMNNLIWEENLDDWSVHSTYFETTCSNLDEGFTTGIFTFYREVNSGLLVRRFESEVVITPTAYEVYIVGKEYYPVKSRWKGTALAEMMIMGNQAVEIAEQNGGNDFWANPYEVCELSVNFIEQEWIVTYSLDDLYRMHKFLKFRISPIDGEILEIITGEWGV